MAELETRGRPVRVGSGTVVGVDAIAVSIEAVMHGDAKNAQLLGSVDRVVREAYLRVLHAFRSVGLPPPRGIPTVNFAPAELPKSGTGFDLPLALALAGAGAQVEPARLHALAAFGEVGLDGRILPARGVVPVAVAAREHGWRALITGPADAAHAAVVPGIDVLAAETLGDALRIAAAGNRSDAVVSPTHSARTAATRSPDLADIRGHETAKRALCVAAAGRHNVLLIGPPGSGKSALARRAIGLLPPAAPEEQLDILRIRSAHGDAPGGAPDGRPFRAPHHSSSAASVLGGGSCPRPGEVTLAHHGVLFLDELPEFRREALEGLRQPLEEHAISIGRAQQTVTLPADFVLIAAMNPCPCGYDGDPRQVCRCTSRERERYRRRISGPLLDRFDAIVRVPTLEPEDYERPCPPAWATPALRQHVLAAVDLARAREHGPNGRLDGEHLQHIAELDDDAKSALRRLTRVDRLTGRGRTRLLRVARTVADLAGSERIRDRHVLEAGRLRKG